MISNDQIFLKGGRQCKRPVKAFEVYETETRSWNSLPNLPCKRTHGGVIWDSYGRLCLLGGLRQGGGHQSSKFTKNISIFDTNQGTKIKQHYFFLISPICLLYFAFSHLFNVSVLWSYSGSKNIVTLCHCVITLQPHTVSFLGSIPPTEGQPMVVRLLRMIQICDPLSIILLWNEDHKRKCYVLSPLNISI